MDLLPVTADYDAISERMRQMAAATYMELIEGLRPYVAEALCDPAGIHDTEPGRLLAYTGLVKLQATLIKELGALYRVADRPRVEEEAEESMPVSEVQLLLDEAQRREDKAVAAAAAEAEVRTRAALEQREVVDLAVARDRVARGLKALGR
jgi:crotonobetainyl-CoA:carnitine CoA-transferase CaiB-like acyl-CoA transferase